ncbi:hypothetical protein ACFSSC_07930 [Corynebacterium mendelii]|uniref:DUF4149 domain-containing protein n=1 Tax=Corynebacterium mendelii TaxID=2765362 RepID=A0A939IY43_9CORY|nr:hypothetical protein [Corynebacterium mendelii]MBN9644738.1 hypothetical protein [Corynebacterium mendelii]
MAKRKKTRLPAALCLILPVFWLGLLVAISGIEAPLKFLAPGITIPLGLGIGRLVFTALNIVEFVVAALLFVAARNAAAPKPFRTGLYTAIGLLVFKAILIRPFLNARTNAVIAGTGETGSIWHWFYMGADTALGLVLIFLVVRAAQRWIVP